jgi:enoyl-CoA hydratase
MTTGKIDLIIKDQIARITIEDLSRFNAMSLSMWQDLREKFIQISQDPSLRACLIRGAGDKSFISGANISEFEEQRSSDAAVKRYNAAVDNACAAISESPVPVIAAIKGICFGGGLGLALCCDLRYGSSDARFRMPAAKLGLGYGLKSMKTFLKTIPPHQASEAFFTAKIYSAPEAVEIGILNSAVDDVFKHSEEMIEKIKENAPLTIRAAKKAIRALVSQDLQAQQDVERDVERCFYSQDYQEGRAAFREKRTPKFLGV